MLYTYIYIYVIYIYKIIHIYNNNNNYSIVSCIKKVLNAPSQVNRAV